VSDFRQPGVVGAGSMNGMVHESPTSTAPMNQARRLDPELSYRAVAARDSRFDGRFITAVRTTGIYCRPSCPATTPKRANVEFYLTAAAAQGAGYRACRRCLPDAVPGSPEWNLHADLAGRAMRLISDGVVERDGVPGLAADLGYSERHLTRVLTAELGAGPLALARAHRAHDARLLIETTALPVSDIAFAAGFASVRQFNDTIRTVFAATPSELRGWAARRTPKQTPGRITVRLAYRPPFDADGTIGFLTTDALPGVESATDEGGYARSLRLPHGSGTANLVPRNGHVACTLRLEDLRDLGSAVNRLRRLLDLDADPRAVDELLSTDPTLAPSIAAVPGIRLPGCVDGEETVIRALIGHGVPTAVARTALTALVGALGEQLSTPDGELTTLFPTSATIAEHGADALHGPQEWVDTVVRTSAAMAEGRLAVHIGRDTDELRSDLKALPGIEPQVAEYIVMRVLGAPDVLLTSDSALQHGAEALGLPSEPDALTAHSQAWRPWRSYAGVHLSRAANVLPTPVLRSR
jgi:AraC family transcriptional regulator of adaptative response / DNA-3-methyladenine glycosylase II